MSWSIFNNDGQRKYVSRSECNKFLDSAKSFKTLPYLLCHVMASSGARISEALSLTPESFDFDAGVVVIECLKKRRQGIFRAVPLSPDLLRAMKEWLVQSGRSLGERIWPWSRMTAYRYVRKAMEMAGLTGERAAPKGLRHGFAIGAIQAGVPLNLVQRWLGHADMKTTAIYAAATGPEERSIAARMWMPQQEEAAREAYEDKTECELTIRAIEKARYSARSNILQIPAEKLSVRVLSRVLRYWLFGNTSRENSPQRKNPGGSEVSKSAFFSTSPKHFSPPARKSGDDPIFICDTVISSEISSLGHRSDEATEPHILQETGTTSFGIRANLGKLVLE